MAHVRIGGAWRIVREVFVRVSGTWRRARDLFVRIGGVWRRVLGANRINVIEGSAAGGVQVHFEYLPTLNLWESRAVAPVQLSETRAAFSEVTGRIYIIGGWGGFGSVGTCFEYNPSTDLWTQRASTAGVVGHGMASPANGRIYLLGGQSGGGHNTSTVEYDPVSNVYTIRASMAFPARTRAAAAAIGTQVYAIGEGLPLEEYSPATNSWATRASSLFGARKAGFVPAGNSRLYAVGGIHPPIGPPPIEEDASNTVEEYNPMTNAWAQVRSLPQPEVDPMVGFDLEGNIYAVGGIMSAFMYTPSQNMWSSRAALPLAVHSSGSATTF